MSRDTEQLSEQDREQGAILFSRVREAKHPDDIDALEDWIGNSAERRRLINELVRVWYFVGELGDIPEIQQWRVQAKARATESRWLGSSYGFRSYPAIAASIVAVLVGVASFFYLLPASVVVNVYTTTAGEHKALTLADGSVVELDAASELKVAYSASERDVSLIAGQARFYVAHDKERPFHVAAAGHDVRALGTDFNVDISRARPSISLFTGSVLISRIEVLGKADGPVSQTSVKKTPITKLKPGEQLIIDSQGFPEVRNFDPDIVSAWQKGRIVFEDLLLSEAISVVNRHSTRPIVLDAPVSDRRITGVFNAGDGLAFAQQVATYLPDARLDVSARQIVIKRRKPGVE